MDIEKIKEIIYHPLKKQRLPKCVKHNFDKFSLSTYDLIYPCEMYLFRSYLNSLLDKMDTNYGLPFDTDNAMYNSALRFSVQIYYKFYNKSWTF